MAWPRLGRRTVFRFFCLENVVPVPGRVRLTGVLTLVFSIFFYYYLSLKNLDFGLASAGDELFCSSFFVVVVGSFDLLILFDSFR